MTETKELLEKEFEVLRDELIAKYDEKKMRASGAWADSLEVISFEDRVQLLGEEYTQQLETGRKPGRFPPMQDIKDWIQAKGVFSAALATISLSSLAFLIARKIANSGWARESYGGVELVSEVVTDARIQAIIDKVGAETVALYTDEIIKNLKPAA